MLRRLVSRSYATEAVSDDFVNNLLNKIKNIDYSKPAKPARAPKKAKAGTQAASQAASKSTNSGKFSKTYNKPKANVSRKQHTVKVDGDLTKVISKVNTKKAAPVAASEARAKQAKPKRKVAMDTPAPVKVVKQATEKYVPDVPTSISLLPFTPLLANTARARVLKYALTTLGENKFPLHREINYSTTDKLMGPTRFSLFSGAKNNYREFGHVLSREPLFKNVSLDANASVYRQIVRGEYHTVGDLSQFKNQKLQANAAVVANAVNKHAGLSAAQKLKVYNSATGLKSVQALK